MVAAALLLVLGELERVESRDESVEDVDGDLDRLLDDLDLN